MEKVRRDLEADGEFSVVDSFESHPDFQDELEQMSEEFFEERNPEFAKLLRKVKYGEDED